MELLDQDGRTVLHRAVIARDLGTVEKVATKETVMVKDPTGLTALHLSCLLGDVEITKKLLELIPATTPLSQLGNNGGRTPLHCAIAKQRYALVPVLLKWQPHLIRATDSIQWTALHVAASVGAPVTVLQELVEAGADPRDETKEGYTAGVIATEDGHLHVVKFLLELGEGTNQK